jgi:hypothetical protein
MMYRLIGIMLLLASCLAVAYVTSTVTQIVHDSCRHWREPPPWSFLCPPSTRNGAK